jgi:hypothetical protein
MNWDDGLTATARNIPATDDNPLGVMAGRGIGKSFAIKRRAARLLALRRAEQIGVLQGVQDREPIAQGLLPEGVGYDPRGAQEREPGQHMAAATRRQGHAMTIVYCVGAACAD